MINIYDENELLKNRVLEELFHNKKLREEGKFVAIPWLSFPKLMTVIPGILKKRYTIITANSKVGKTQITDALFLQDPLLFLEKFPNSNIDLHIDYYSLEVSKEDKVLSLISRHIFVKFGILKSPEDLKSYFESYILTDQIAVYLSSSEFSDWLLNILKKVTFIDNVKNPFGIYKDMREKLCKEGKIYDKNGREVQAGQSFDHYIPNNPDKYRIVIVDHYGLFTPENGKELWDAIFDWSSKYAISLRDNFFCHVVGVQQQSSDQEKQSFTFKGDMLVNKLRPSQDGLGDCKLTQRDVNLLIGLFAPSRYKIDQYEGYDLNLLGDNYRELSIILNRNGGGSIVDDLYFDGRINLFEELPKPNSPEMKQIYEKIKTK